jgi:hypothetical protein
MRKALIVGINDYPTSPLRGCVPDAQRMHQLLAMNGDGTPNFDARLITSENQACVTKGLLEAQLELLLMQDADGAIFYFSGHGSRNILGGYLVTQDATKTNQGFPFHDLQTLVLKSPIREITIILDCCYSGAFGNDTTGDGQRVELREGVTIMAASHPEQLAQENSSGGIFTSLLIDALHGEAADITGKITLAGIYHHIDGLLTAWDQRPLYKAHVSHMLPIRTVQPQFQYHELLRLTTLFPTSDHEIRLSPAYEHSVEPRDHAKEEIFALLQRLRDARLVAPVAPHQHLFTAAVESGRCKLTPNGRFYWKMMSKNRV